MKRSNSQLEALKTTTKNRIISAGAGSGKTQVLSQKVNDLLFSKAVEPDSILVLTFTVAAAIEMKERIKKNLILNNFDKTIIEKIDSSHIQTFDSFSMYVVKKYHPYLNISENISILDSTILKLKLNEYLNEIFNEKYKNQDKMFFELLKATCVKTDQELKDLILFIYEKIDVLENKEEFLDHYFDVFFNRSKIETDYYKLIKLFKNTIKDYLEILYSIDNFENSLFSSMLKEQVYETLINIDDRLFYDSLRTFRRKSAKRNELSENDKKLNEIFGKMLQNIKKQLVYVSSFDEQLNIIYERKDIIEYLLKIIKELDLRLLDYKKLTNTFTFNDIAKFSIKLVENNRIREELRSKFKFILVDEYQDTSDIQEKFVNVISNNNLYMVGDIKQSIYRFRYANCDIFKNKYEKYAKGMNGDKVDLVDNFRSRKEILNCINSIFKEVMTNELGGAEYRKDHLINYGLKTYDSNICDVDQYGIKFIEYDNQKKSDSKTEATIICSKIKEMMSNNFQIYDKNLSQLRKLKYSDFAVLLRKKKDFGTYKKVFSEHKIPIVCDIKNPYINFESILLLESLLKGVGYYRNNLLDENIKKFIFSSYYRSYVSNMDDKYIYESIVNGSYVEDKIFSHLKEIAEFSYSHSIEVTVLKIISDFKLIENLKKLKNAKDNFDKLEFIIKKSRSFDSSNLSIDEFIGFFNDIKEFKVDFEIETVELNENAVNLMSIHKSKGLEFPIVFLGNIDESKSKSKQTNIFNKNNGISLQDINDDKIHSFYFLLNKLEEKRDNASEIIRLFYVALTRARESLFILKPSIEKTFEPIYDRPSFLNILNRSNVEIKNQKYNLNYLDIDSHSLINEEISIKKLTYIDFSYEFENISNRASSSIDLSIIDDNLEKKLDFGTKIHEYLEIIDFNNPDFSFIDDELIRRKIRTILNLDLFSNIKNGDIYKEYEFIDEDNSLKGIIDLFIVYNDHIDLIDYKLKNIDKKEYNEQLNKYRSFLERKFKKRCNTFLISIIEERYEEVV